MLALRAPGLALTPNGTHTYTIARVMSPCKSRDRINGKIIMKLCFYYCSPSTKLSSVRGHPTLPASRLGVGRFLM